jgi:hypothetical protein
VLSLEDAFDAFDMLGLDLKTLSHHPKSAMKLVMKF